MKIKRRKKEGRERWLERQIQLTEQVLAERKAGLHPEPAEKMDPDEYYDFGWRAVMGYLHAGPVSPKVLKYSRWLYLKGIFGMRRRMAEEYLDEVMRFLRQKEFSDDDTELALYVYTEGVHTQFAANATDAQLEEHSALLRADERKHIN